MQNITQGSKIKKSIRKEIENQKNVYLSDNTRIIADYNNELETINEYNGRQLFELLQNADDELADEVFISINTNKNTLVIANKGNDCKPFTVGGIKSLMVANFSPKTTKKYIGSKGLGFRSIVNWSNKVTINSQNMAIKFSREIAENFYNEICDEKKQREIAEQRNLSRNIKPIAFLAVPEISDKIQDKWTTVIEIEYKDNFSDHIINQVNNIQNEILLFVNNINKIKISINEKTKIIERIKDNNLIYVNNKLWTIYNKTNLLPQELWDKENEEERYELKIAIQENFDNNNNFLYSYFPTKIDIDFPFIIHGTFDLNSSRNDLNDNPKNRFVLKKLVELIVDSAKELTKNEVSYKALELLTHNNKNTTLNNLDFYKKIDTAINELDIFPCLDNTYRKKDEVVYINDSFSNFIKRTDNKILFPNLLISNNDAVDIQKFNLKSSVQTEKLNELSSNIDSVDDRVELIYIFYNTFKHENQLVFLIDNDNNLVKLNDVVYTPITKDYDLNIPDFVKIKFINNELFEKLLDVFKIDSNEKSRDLQRVLKNITNIQSYEPAQILQKIITSTNKELEKENNNKVEIIKKMVFSLYKNNKILGLQTKIPENTKVQLISRDNKVKNSKDLFLSKTYPSGKLTEDLFGDIFEEDKFLANIELFTFDDDEDIEQIESFFLWLGTNKYTKFNSKTDDNSYVNYVFKKVDKPDNYRSSNLELNYIDNFKLIIQNLSKEKLILWLSKDIYIKNQLEDDNKDIFNYDKKSEYTGFHTHTIFKKPSYILYQLISSNIFKDYLITNEKFSFLVNKKTIDFNCDLFKKYNIRKSDIESLILKIGAIDKFENLSIGTVRNILRNLPKNSPDGKQVLTIYKEAITHYKKHKQSLDDNQILISGKKEYKLAYYPQSEVYYNGNIKLPKKITDSKSIINYPRRQNTKSVIDFFGIKNLKSIDITIQEHLIATNLTQDFKSYFNKIVPYILVYRFEDSITEVSRKKDLSSINNISIQLCSQVRYKMEVDSYELDNNDYIKNEKNYYIKVDSTKTFEKLRKELDFRETFSDVIGSVFDITDTEKYSRLISDNIQETEEIIKRNIGYDAILRAREFLGISDEIYSFWNTIFSLKNKVYDSDKNTLQYIKEILEIKIEILNIDYKNLQSFKSCQYIEKLFIELKIDLESFNQNSFSFYKLNFSSYHEHKLKNCFNDNFYNFKQLLYKWCQVNSKEKQFLNLIGLYEHNKEVVGENKINVDYQSAVRIFVNKNYDFILDSEIDVKIDFENIYEKNENRIDFEKIEYSNEYRSLLYFESTLGEIEKIIEDINKNSQSIDESFNKNDKNKPILLIDLSDPTDVIQKLKLSRKPYKHSHQTDRQNKESGDKAERDVFNSLVTEFGKENVEWTSKDDDSLGYDIRYKNKDNIWKNVEVKAYSNGIFYLSKNEKMFADRHKDSYEIFLVGEEIYKLSDVDFSNIDKFKLVVNKYEVYYKIKE